MRNRVVPAVPGIFCLSVLSRVVNVFDWDDPARRRLRQSGREPSADLPGEYEDCSSVFRSQARPALFLPGSPGSAAGISAACPSVAGRGTLFLTGIIADQGGITV